MPQKQQPLFGKKALVLGGLLLAVGAMVVLIGDRLSLDYLAQQEQVLRQFQLEYPGLVYVLAFFVYVAVTGLSLPGATALSLLYAWFFGFLPAVVLVSFASTAGATVAFLLSRYFFRDAIQTRFGGQLKSFNQALEREGAFYLFTLRLIPAVPFFVINAVMGLTNIPTRTFWWVSQVGMLAGTCVYVYAGASIPRLEQLADPSQLRTQDIVEPRQFAKLLDQDSTNPAGLKLRSDLTEQDRHWLDAFSDSSGDVTEEQLNELVAMINLVIKRPSFSLENGPAQVNGEDEKVPALESREMERQVTQANRELLVKAFPGHIQPVRPIISPQLLVAFCLLWIFPIAAKRTMQWIRSKKHEPEDHVATHPA